MLSNIFLHAYETIQVVGIIAKRDAATSSTMTIPKRVVHSRKYKGPMKFPVTPRRASNPDYEIF